MTHAGTTRTPNMLSLYDTGAQHPALAEIRRRYRALHASQWWPEDEIRELQLRCAARLVAHASKQVPLYRRHYGDNAQVSSWEEFLQLPTLTRTMIEDADKKDWIAEWTPPVSRPVSEAYTSGTTGRIIRVPRTPLMESWRAGCRMREYEWSGTDPGLSCAHIRHRHASDDPGWDEKRQMARSAWWEEPALGRLLGFGPGFFFDVSPPPKKMAAVLKELEPAYICSTPTMLDILLEHLRPYRPATLFTIGENLYDPVRERLEAGYGALVYDIYAVVEVGRAAAQCPQGNGYHVHDENVILEVVDERGRPAAPGVPSRVLLTALHNFAAPVIRYEIGDLAELSPDPCPCGRRLTFIRRFHGREISRIALPGGRRRVASSLMAWLGHLPHLKGFQLRQKAFDRFELFVVAKEALSSREMDTVRSMLEQMTEQPIDLKVVPVDEVPMNPAGKVAKVVIEVEADS
ncbi:MAG: phenylacetate--CoA ligase family protein [Armatimonadetes bacterium]|nr:phenylacetate--CoA ligase family protein [Armatimonadota bacterium]